MGPFSEAQFKEAEKFGEFYIDLIENYKNNIKYYLTEDVTLDWFGQTIKGEKNVANFLKTKLTSVKHFLPNAIPIEKIGFRDTHTIKKITEPKKLDLNFLSPPRLESNPKTPTKHQAQPSTSSIGSDEKGQGDGLHNLPPSVSPAKKFRPGDFRDNDSETVECELENLQVKYMTVEGSVQFHRPSLKKLQAETKWKRPCKLSIAYTCTSNFSDFSIYLIIYEGNMKCRRNLMKDFEAAEAEN